MPLDDLTVAADVIEGHVIVHPISFGVGKGRLLGNVDLTPQSGKNVHARMDLHLQNLDVSRLMAATQTFEGAGSVSGVGAIDATGDSLASLLANGDGEVKMAMAGGNLSALLIDLTGLQFGNALLSALGVPKQTPVQCFVGDLGLRRGVLDFNALTLDTGEAITNVGGNIDLGKKTIDLTLKTDPKHFTVGSLPTRIRISGTFKDPSIRPGAEVAARVGAVAGLAALFAPLAILPTIQFGTSEADDVRCGELLPQARASAGGAPGRQAGCAGFRDATLRFSHRMAGCGSGEAPCCHQLVATVRPLLGKQRTCHAAGLASVGNRRGLPPTAATLPARRMGWGHRPAEGSPQRVDGGGPDLPARGNSADLRPTIPLPDAFSIRRSHMMVWMSNP